eukprot:CAMPEP_0201121586 /NCGR_PEP_ID=MMETSP0850-20130426/5440_1 /ASSEMBLY_ACC=CAM_ASM_000622 /TAXON_ID=183588 /ORGANISM="Pseudo-nitzschia fraudulenta, Strain WWA7" /LENGTH=353 /DNA_ID=CAMNT_0047388091 /DNA_START=159 /DNA_END=1220 /DNA_ORIENTATION=+
MISKRQPFSNDFRLISSTAFYILSGCIQPLIVSLLKEAGLADPRCQLSMTFYYAMPALFIFPLLLMDQKESWPKRCTTFKAAGIAVWDIIAQTLNYTGASLSGPTIFAIIYSSVTIWSAVFSQILLGRTMNGSQWMNVIIVFAGLAITAIDSVNMGDSVLKGSVFVICGSAMHGLFYVMSEAVMVVGEEKLTVLQNNFVQALVAGSLFSLWQGFFTLPHFDEFIGHPMENAGTSIYYALILLCGFGASSIVHSITFYYTLRHFPGGATSAGIMKGLQAVLVFLLTDYFYCNKLGGPEMCFSVSKFISLVTVSGGVLGYGYATKIPGSSVATSDSLKKEFNEVSETSTLLEASP